MIRDIVLAVAVIIVCLLVASAAYSQEVCGLRQDIVSKLNTQFKEYRAGVGLLANGMLVELFVSEDDKRTFTIIYTAPGANTCLVGVGDNWEFVKKTLKKEGTY